ncbi:hypothetical protein A6U87_06610 [Rhizobium sp. AC44/96]|uniref:hypothetical protein n=1 Tax=Rhizobium sp. AC44/96 TaxID=1841654 RepID=UPI00080FD977|nr:hypothetical protein [Rhizobium sp. AC44/96]OCJ12967.1 hypothetical protein A6U87_06610 [Rhizobium sp. AC44/96]
MVNSPAQANVASCGTIAWWRGLDLNALRTRYGAIEHLLVQMDFMAQVARLPRAEFSIPGASKTIPGGIGFADVVALATQEIWEIKSDSYMPMGQAGAEAKFYAKMAQVGCGSPTWRAGQGYTTFDGTGVVWRASANNNTAELHAVEKEPGSIYYYWKINGQEGYEVYRQFGWGLRGHLVDTLFLGVAEDLLYPDKPKGAYAYSIPDLRVLRHPPLKWTSPTFQGGALIAALQSVATHLLNVLRTECARQILEGSAVGVYLESGAFAALTGQTSNTIDYLSVRPRPGQIGFSTAQTLTMLSEISALNVIKLGAQFVFVANVIGLAAVAAIVGGRGLMMLGPAAAPLAPLAARTATAFIIFLSAEATAFAASKGPQSDAGQSLIRQIDALYSSGKHIINRNSAILVIPDRQNRDGSVSFRPTWVKWKPLTPGDLKSQKIGVSTVREGDTEFILSGVAVPSNDLL